MRISEHFTREELTRTGRDLPNSPSAGELEALADLCARVLEPVRAALGVPLRVTSGYRSPAVNAAIGGARASQHLRGEAADLIPVGLDPEEAMRRIATLAPQIPLGQAILYRSGFLHLSIDRRGTPRRQLLRSDAAGGSGGPYRPWEAP